MANFERQTWDREHYEKLAQLRANGKLPETEVRYDAYGYSPSFHPMWCC